MAKRNTSKDNKKILVSTILPSMNAGAFLQAFALSRYLLTRGWRTVFIRGGVRSPLKETLRLLGAAFRKGSFRLTLFIFRQYVKLHSNYRRLPVISLKRAARKNGRGSVLICGSDEVWNVKRPEIRAFPCLAGAGIPVEKKIAFAVSAGDSDLRDFEKAPEFLREIGTFTALSVRDPYTADVIEAISGERPAEVLDPVFLIDWSGSRQNKGKDCIFVYSYYKLLHDETFGKKVISLAAKYNLRIVTMGSIFCKWADRSLCMDPGLFLEYISDARFVLTDTFHGTAFSVIFRRCFACVSDRCGGKCRQLLELFGLEERRMGSAEDPEEYFLRPVDFASAEQALREGKEKSELFLEAALSETENMGG